MATTTQDWVHEPLGELGRVRVSKRTAPDGGVFVDLRAYFPDDGGEMRPTKKGVMIPEARWPELREIVCALCGEERLGE